MSAKAAALAERDLERTMKAKALAKKKALAKANGEEEEEFVPVPKMAHVVWARMNLKKANQAVMESAAAPPPMIAPGTGFERLDYKTLVGPKGMVTRDPRFVAMNHSEQRSVLWTREYYVDNRAGAEYDSKRRHLKYEFSEEVLDAKLEKRAVKGGRRAAPKQASSRARACPAVCGQGTTQPRLYPPSARRQSFDRLQVPVSESIGNTVPQMLCMSRVKRGNGKGVPGKNEDDPGDEYEVVGDCQQEVQSLNEDAGAKIICCAGAMDHGVSLTVVQPSASKIHSLPALPPGFRDVGPLVMVKPTEHSFYKPVELRLSTSSALTNWDPETAVVLLHNPHDRDSFSWAELPTKVVEDKHVDYSDPEGGRDAWLTCESRTCGFYRAVQHAQQPENVDVVAFLSNACAALGGGHCKLSVWVCPNRADKLTEVLAREEEKRQREYWAGFDRVGQCALVLELEDELVLTYTPAKLQKHTLVWGGSPLNLEMTVQVPRGHTGAVCEQELDIQCFSTKFVSYHKIKLQIPCK
jgi:hypothetical protein